MFSITKHWAGAHVRKHTGGASHASSFWSKFTIILTIWATLSQRSRRRSYLIMRELGEEPWYITPLKLARHERFPPGRQVMLSLIP